MGLVTDEILRVEKCYGFTKNPAHEIERQVQEMDFIRWCRKETGKQPISFAGLPSRLYEKDKKTPWYQVLTALLP